MKKAIGLLSGLMILSMILSACAPQTVEVVKTVTVEKVVQRWSRLPGLHRSKKSFKPWWCLPPPSRSRTEAGDLPLVDCPR